MESVISNGKYCYACGNGYGLHSHHIYPGPDRPKAEARGLKVWLCFQCHEQLHMHPNKGLDKQLKETAQEYYESHYGSREDFRKEFRRSYL